MKDKRACKDTGVCKKKKTPFTREVALQSSSRNCSPAPDLFVLLAYVPTRFLLLRSVFSQTPVLRLFIKIKWGRYNKKK